MAQQVNVKFVDDLDGSDAAGTVSFGLDGRTYEIDLSDDNAARLRNSLTSFIAAARKSGRSTTTGSPRAEDDRKLRATAPGARPRADRGDPGLGPAERPPGLQPRPHLQDSRAVVDAFQTAH
jgi:Lsr2